MQKEMKPDTDFLKIENIKVYILFLKIILILFVYKDIRQRPFI